MVSEVLSFPAGPDDRVERTNAVLERYRHRAFDWQAGTTCIHLFRSQAVAMGHTMPPLPLFRSALGARRALKARGAESVTGLIDAMLPGRRITPASMWVGDVGALPGEDGLDALLIWGGGKLLGWHGDDPSRMVSIELSAAEVAAHLVAWRLG